MVSDTVGDINCAVVPDRAIMCYPFRWRVAIIQMLQPATKHSTHGVCHRWRANQKWANMRRANQRKANQRRANRRTSNDGRANSRSRIGHVSWIHRRSGIDSGSRIGCGCRIGCGSRIIHRSGNGQVRCQGFRLSRGSQLSRGPQMSRWSRGWWFLRGWPGGVSSPYSLPQALFGPLLQDVHQCPPDSILPVLTIQTFATSSVGSTLQRTTELRTYGESQDNLVSHCPEVC